MIKQAVKKYKVVAAAAAILAVLVLHFAWQISFVQKENLRALETSLKNDELNADLLPVAPPEPKAEIKTDKQPDRIETNQPFSENVITKTEKSVEMDSEKTIESTSYRRAEPKNTAKTANKKAARETEAERLRRAEKLLTGM